MSNLLVRSNPLKYLFHIVTVDAVQAPEARREWAVLKGEVACSVSIPSRRAVNFFEQVRPATFHGKIHELVEGIRTAWHIGIVVTGKVNGEPGTGTGLYLDYLIIAPYAPGSY